MGSRRPVIALLWVALLCAVPVAQGKGPPAALAESARAGVWVAQAAAPLRLVDPSDGRAIASVAAGRLLTDVTARYGSVWAVGLAGVLARVDEISARVTARRRLPVDLGWRVAATDRWVWVVGTRDGARTSAVLLRIDPATLRVAGTFHLGSPEPPALAVGHGAVWLAMNASGSRGNRSTLVGIDERTGRARVRRGVAGAPRDAASDGPGVWLLTEDPGRPSRLTLVGARSGAVLRSGPVPAGASRLAARGDLIWVARDSVAGSPRPLSLRGYDPAGRLVAGPWPIACRGGPRPALLADLLATTGVTAIAAVADDRGRIYLASASRRGGVRGCVPLAG